MIQIGIYQMLDPLCAQRRIKLVFPIPNYFKIYFCPKLTLSLKRQRRFKIYNAVKAFMESQLYEILYEFYFIIYLTPLHCVDKAGLTLSYSSIRGTSRRSWATTSACFLSVYLNAKDKYRSPLGCLSWIQIRIQKRFRPHCGQRRLKLVLPFNQRNFM